MPLSACSECSELFNPNVNVISYLEDKFAIPKKTICEDCVQRRLFIFRNERKLYKNKSSLSGKDMISIYSPDKPYPVYTQEEWNSDRWDPFDYWQDYDFSRGFFEQFNKLFQRVPKPNLYNLNSENCEYNNGIVDSKNAYMNFYGSKIIDSNYTTASYDINDSNDVWWSAMIDKSYEIISCDHTYGSFFCIDCSGWRNLLFCEDCVNCSDCIMCYGLKGKKFHIKNKEYDELEYAKIKNWLEMWNHKLLEQYKSEFKEFLKSMPRKWVHELSCENCSWDHLFESKNCMSCFTVVWWENGYNVFEWWRFLEVYDSAYVYDSKYVFDSALIAWNSYNIFFSVWIWKSRDIYYSNWLDWCQDCFWCTWLLNKSFCILNKQYSKEDYLNLKNKIIEAMKEDGEWWELFPASLSPFGYNETVADDHYSIAKDDALSKWFNWSDYESPKPDVKKIIPASKLPPSILDIPDDILNWAIECEITNKPFRIIKPELEFYRKHNLPVPRIHPDQRHLDRMSFRNPKKLYGRACDNCKIDMKTAYSPLRSELIFCEKCFTDAMYR
ncbi:MAG: hypothetical protein ACD_2C00091G0017 [uncultured bacterium (gcode 4)]|uniref:Caib/baif family protein n=1 Tax=uncultured bacterium (gcode 4) TaxID=1234023 RepID=K2FF40_9BACT|nr:MAG: hypothetical protein ACD_2C00091G0017 [uncultured bacterium (gcode 4)]